MSHRRRVRELTAFAACPPAGCCPSMSIRFAGSRSVDDRRRRRLAQEAEIAPAAPVTRRVAKSAAERPAEEVRLPRGSSPADSLIFPQLWKHAILGVACMAIWALVLVLGDWADQARSGLETVIGLTAGHLPRFFSTVMLLAAGQLALINLWYRSRSRKDFSGSYKVWFYAAVGWLTLCAFAATGSHWHLADAVLAGRPVAIWNGRLLTWMIPGAIIVLAIYRLLLREMRDCDASLWLLRFSLLVAMATAGVLIAGPFVLVSRSHHLLATGLGTGWHLLLAAAMLLHARHVIHHSNEPPVRPLTRWGSRWHQLSSWFAVSRSRTRPTAKGKSAGKSRGPAKSKLATKMKRGASSRSKAASTSASDIDTDQQEAAANDDDRDQETDHRPGDRSSSGASRSSTAAASSSATATARVAAGAQRPDGVRSPASSTSHAASGGSVRRVDPPQAVKSAHMQSGSGQRDDDTDESDDAADSDQADLRGQSRKDRKRQLRQLRQSGRS